MNLVKEANNILEEIEENTESCQSPIGENAVLTFPQKITFQPQIVPESLIES